MSEGEGDRSLVEMFERTCAKHAARPAIGTKRGGWVWTSYDELRQLVNEFRVGLSSLGVGAGDRVGIVADNRLEWAVAAYATYGLGAAFVPMYEAQRREDWEFILQDSGCKVAIAASEAIGATLRDMQRTVPDLEHVVSLETTAPSFSGLLTLGPTAHVPPVHPDPDDVANLIYTSGTTGKPKGVILTHGNVMSNVNSVHQIFDFTEQECSLSFIPWAHVFGQTCELHTMLSLGAAIAVNDALPHLADNLLEVQPTALVAVPRIFNRIFASVNAQVAERPPVIRHLFDAGVRAAKEKQRHEHVSIGDWAALALADPLIFSKVRARFGGRLKYAVSGGAALAKEVAELIQAIGITVYEGYGLTETSPMISANRPGHVKLGSVGKVIPGVTVRIDTSVGHDGREGEIIVFGPNVMKGYHNRPEEQARAFTSDGGFRTGDIGYLDEDGFLFITGRIKEQYKLENGKYVAPVPLEEQLKLSPFIASAMLHGANKPYNVALLVLNAEAIEKWAAAQGIRIENPERDPRVHDLIKNELATHASGFREFERPQRFVLTMEDFTLENKMLTPTLKVKRPLVLARYGEALDALYREASAA